MSNLPTQPQQANKYIQQLNQTVETKPPAIQIAQGTSSVVTENGVTIGSIYRKDTKQEVVKAGQDFFFIPVYITTNIIEHSLEGNHLDDDNFKSKATGWRIMPLIKGKNDHLLRQKMIYFDPKFHQGAAHSGHTVSYRRNMVILAYPYLMNPQTGKGEFFRAPFQIPLEGMNIGSGKKLAEKISSHLLADPSNTPFDFIFKMKTVMNTGNQFKYFTYSIPEVFRETDDAMKQKAGGDWEIANKIVQEKRLAFESDESDLDVKVVDAQPAQQISQQPVAQAAPQPVQQQAPQQQPSMSPPAMDTPVAPKKRGRRKSKKTQEQLHQEAKQFDSQQPTGTVSSQDLPYDTPDAEPVRNVQNAGTPNNGNFGNLMDNMNNNL